MKTNRSNCTVRKFIKKSKFTLIELVASLAILAIVILAAFQMFSTMQKAWDQSEAQREIFENARIAIDMISRDLQGIYYGADSAPDGIAPFWHWDAPVKDDTDSPFLKNLPASWDEYRREMIAFVSDTPFPPNSECNSTLCEIKYQLYYATNHKDEFEGWLRRSSTGYKKEAAEGSGVYVDDTKWNYYDLLIKKEICLGVLMLQIMLLQQIPTLQEPFKNCFPM